MDIIKDILLTIYYKMAFECVVYSNVYNVDKMFWSTLSPLITAFDKHKIDQDDSLHLDNGKFVYIVTVKNYNAVKDNVKKLDEYFGREGKISVTRAKLSNTDFLNIVYKHKKKDFLYNIFGCCRALREHIYI